MKKADTNKPQFKQAWWKKNKATTLKSTGFGKVLLAYEGALKKAGANKPKTLSDVLAALRGISVAADKALKDCSPLLHKETIAGLKSYQKIAGAAEKKLKPVESRLMKAHDANDKINSVEDALKLRDFEEFSKKVFISEHYDFLKTMRKKSFKGDEATYLEFVKVGSKNEINIVKGTRAKFDAIAASGKAADWKEAPWKIADKQVRERMMTDRLKDFRTFRLERAIELSAAEATLNSMP